jgi:hypothetical protein
MPSRTGGAETPQSLEAISASFLIVFMLRAVPGLAAGIFNLDVAMPAPKWM